MSLFLEKEESYSDGTYGSESPVEVINHELTGHAIPWATQTPENAVENENKVKNA